MPFKNTNTQWEATEAHKSRARAGGRLPMSLSQYAIFLYTSSHTVTVTASRILGMNLVMPGSSWISITTSWQVQKHQFLIGHFSFLFWLFPAAIFKEHIKQVWGSKISEWFCYACIVPCITKALSHIDKLPELYSTVDTAGGFKLLQIQGETLPRNCSRCCVLCCCVFKPAVPGRGAWPGRQSRGKGCRWADWPAIWTELSSRVGSRTPHSQLWDCSVSPPAETGWQRTSEANVCHLSNILFDSR